MSMRGFASFMSACCLPVMSKRIATPSSKRNLRTSVGKRGGAEAAPHPDRPRQSLEHLDRRLPIDAAVGDALAVAQGLAGHQVLLSADQMAFDHHADDAAVAVLDLPRDRIDHHRLVLRIVAAV